MNGIICNNNLLDLRRFFRAPPWPLCPCAVYCLEEGLQFFAGKMIGYIRVLEQSTQL